MILAWLCFLGACAGGVEVESPGTAAADGSGPPVSSAVNGGSSSSTTHPSTSPPTTASTTTTSPPITVPDPVEVALARLTTEQKIGQLLMPVLFGADANDVSRAEAAANLALGGAATPADLVRGNDLGGVLYLGSNVVDAEQVERFSAGLQLAADDGIGLLVAVDQEGGRVNRITSGVTVFPSARSLAGDATAVNDAAVTTGTELGALGINTVLAPVADLTDGAGVIGDRSYGSDPELAAEMVVAAINGLASTGVAPAVKHWPGHGATTVDSHSRLPVIDTAFDVWAGRERRPFEAAIDAGVDIVLVGHLAFPQLDSSGAPATVSPTMIQTLLRQDLGFEGVVMTDALDMGAVGNIDEGELVVQALLAGVDIMLVPPDLEAAKAGLQAALAEGRVTDEQLDESVRRVLRLKSELGLLVE